MKYREYIVRYYASHDDIPAGHQDGEIVEELVRCKDCRYAKRSELLPDLFRICKLEDITKAKEDFCECGERRKR